MKKIIIGYVVLMAIIYMACLPQSNERIIELIFATLFMSLGGFMLIFLWKLPKLTGYSEEELPLIHQMFQKMLPHIFPIPMIVISIICLIRLLITKDIVYSVVLLPTISFCYNSYKIYINQNPR